MKKQELNNPHAVQKYVVDNTTAFELDEEEEDIDTIDSDWCPVHGSAENCGDNDEGCSNKEEDE